LTLTYVVTWCIISHKYILEKRNLRDEFEPWPYTPKAEYIIHWASGAYISTFDIHLLGWCLRYAAEEKLRGTYTVGINCTYDGADRVNFTWNIVGCIYVLIRFIVKKKRLAEKYITSRVTLQLVFVDIS